MVPAIITTASAAPAAASTSANGTLLPSIVAVWLASSTRISCTRALAASALRKPSMGETV